MEIDRAKFKLKMEVKVSSGGGPKTTMEYFDECEIKPIDCDECHYDPINAVNENSYCYRCPDNPNLKSNFKPKQNELDKLFVGAPVMVKNNNDSEYELRVYYKMDEYISSNLLTFNPSKPQEESKGKQIPYNKGVYTWNYHRLPTVEEAPRNVWLAPWIEMPKELLKHHILFRYSGHIYDNESEYPSPQWDWVEAIMILEDFKK